MSAKSQDILPYKPLADFKNDTLSFMLYNFKDRAEAYKGKTVKQVVQDLQIPINHFLSGIYYYDKARTNNFYIFIYDKKRTQYLRENNQDDGAIYIILRDLFKKSELKALQDKEDPLGWNNSMYKYLENKVIHKVSFITSRKDKYYEMYYSNGSVVPIGFTGITDYTSVLKAKVSDHMMKPTAYSINFKLSEKTEIRVKHELFYTYDKSFKIHRSFIKKSDGKMYTMTHTKSNDKLYNSSIITLDPGTYTFTSEMEAYDAGLYIDMLTKNVQPSPTSYKNVTYNGGTQLANFDEDSPTDFESFAYCKVSDQLSEPTSYTINFRVNRERSEIKVNYELSDNENNSFRIYGISIKGNGTTYNLDSTKTGANEYESKESITLPPGDYSITTKMAASGVGVHINLLGKYAQ